MNKATASKIDYLDLTARVRLNEDVLRLKITVDQLEIVYEGQRVQDLLRDLPQARYIEVKLLLNLSIVLRVLVEVVA